VGGGIAGPTLALMLERNGIDFVVLEAYGSIAPQLFLVHDTVSNTDLTVRELEEKNKRKETKDASILHCWTHSSLDAREKWHRFRRP
jgi:2-polyprenyl-6-methoxyphenol hydroxylase-like FAD-dependent oxidoreductase